MSRGIFITGTDTGVGKTYVAAGIAIALKERGIYVGVMKPAETGCSMRAGRLIPRDALRLMKAAGVRDSLSLVNPYRFRQPLAPSTAASLERKKISLDKIINVYQKLSTRHEFMIVEGAGGIMVPLSQNVTYLDLAEALDIPVLIVARPGLGTINHTLLTVFALLERNVTIAGIVINHANERKPGLAERTNPALIEKLSGVTIAGIIPYGAKEFGRIIEQLKLVRIEPT
jgi:dethiobiotin synthetase